MVTKRASFLRQNQRPTYRKPRIVDRTLDDADLERQCSLDNGRHDPQPSHSMGRLDVLPHEIMADILLLLDLPTLTAFRCLSRRAMSLVDSLPQYRMMVRHCANVLRAILSINAKWFSCATLYNTLTSAKCENCDRFGSYLYLIACKRVCYFCFTSDPKYLPVSATQAIKYTGLERRELERIPHILSLPGRYTARNKLSRKRLVLFDQHSVLQRTPANLHHGRGIDSAEQQARTTRDPRRYMSVISAPCISASDQTADWGFYGLCCCRDGAEVSV